MRVVVLGAGRIGAVHARAVRDVGGTLAGIADSNEGSASALARELGCAVLSVDEVLAGGIADGVVIATPTDTHVDLLQRARQTGLRVLCEKPLAMDLAAARSCLDYDEVQIGFQRRFDPTFQAFRERARSSGVLHGASFTSRDPDLPSRSYLERSGGLFFDMAIHDFDMVRWLFGREVVRVSAAGAALSDPSVADLPDIDTALITLTLEGGALVSIQCSRRSGYGYDQRVEAYGSAGAFFAANPEASGVVHWGAAGRIADRPQSFFLERYAVAYREQMRHFLSRGRDGAGPVDGVRAQLIAAAARRSYETGGAPVTPEEP